MIFLPELGHLLLIFMGIHAFYFALRPAHLDRTKSIQLFSSGMALALLVGLFVSLDFSVLLVANNASEPLPIAYRIAATWGSHEGSMLLWCFMLACWTFFVRGKKELRLAFGLQAIFISFLLFVSDPFARLLPAAVHGADLNPLLQDPLMTIHPPILYAGYVGMMCPFVVAVAGAWRGRIEVNQIWRATLLPWCFLTLGILLGSYWAYYELGWGGYWFWDPVENASLLPWLAATATLHATQRTKNLAAFSAVSTFIMSVVGTFLVRSGALVSVHSFATSPERGMYLLSIAAVISLVAYGFVLRLPPGRYTQRGSLRTLVSLLLLTVLAAVLFGTLYPIFLESIGRPVSVGAPYFIQVLAPILAIILLVMSLAYYPRYWLVGLAVTASFAVWLAGYSFLSIILMPLALVSLVALVGWLYATMVARKNKCLSLVAFGQFAVHFGFCVLVIGVLLNHNHSAVSESRMYVGDSVIVGGSEFKLTSLDVAETDAKRALVATVQSPFGKSTAQKAHFKVRDLVVSESAIIAGIYNEYVVTVGQVFSDNSVGIKVQHEPYVRIIWLSGLFMIMGVLALWQNLRRC